MKIFLTILIIMIGLTIPVRAQLHTENVQYKDGNTQLEGYLAYDESIKGQRPGIVVVHEWWGMTPYIKMRTEELAKLGYVAFAADIYGKGILPKNADEAQAQSKIYNNDRQLMRRRAQAALDELKKNKLVDQNNIAAMGYCFGGGVALEMARAGNNLKGVVSFHGSIANPNPEDAKNIKGKVLVLTGGSDPFITPQVVTAFEDEMTKAGVDWQVDVYGGAVHSFTNPNSGNDPSKGVAYNEKADKRSWQAMKEFFAEIFPKQ